ncbi:MAG: CYTH domain-containing protein [Thermodesulfobacteriota bacterium]|nr:CYTH domain-containing protein [Thermodesulfobacteriota bacterium]
MGLEFEVTFVILSLDPLKVMDRILGLSSIGPYDLVFEKELVFTDRYFDTHSGELMDQRLGLRLRQSENTGLICMKDAGKTSAFGGIKRTEIEGPWTGEAMDIILDALRERGIIRDSTPCNLSGISDSAGFLYGLGLHIIQKRETIRQITKVLYHQVPVARIDLDTVRYQADKAEILHHEMEIELKDAQEETHLERLAGLFEERFYNELMPWGINKLLTGFALESMYKKGMIQGSQPDRHIYEEIMDMGIT